MAARQRGGRRWTVYRANGNGEWTGTLLQALEVLRPYLPRGFFPPGELGRSVEHIKKKLNDHITKNLALGTVISVFLIEDGFLGRNGSRICAVTRSGADST